HDLLLGRTQKVCTHSSGRSRISKADVQSRRSWCSGSPCHCLRFRRRLLVVVGPEQRRFLDAASAEDGSALVRDEPARLASSDSESHSHSRLHSFGELSLPSVLN